MLGFHYLWLIELSIYLKTDKKKIIFINSLLSGTFPVIFSIIGQIIFRWEGPFSTLGNSIIWFHKPINFENYNAVQGIAGLFSNQIMLHIGLQQFPFLNISNQIEIKIFPKILLIRLNFIFIFCIILTDSRMDFRNFCCSWFILSLNLFLYVF